MSPGITYAIGDVHGRLDLLLLAVDAIQADLGERSGRVVMLGDYVDRGPDSAGVVKFLMHSQKHGSVTCLKGNHEAMMVDAMRGRGDDLWLGNGGVATLKSYGPGGVPDEHVAWMDALPSCATLGNRIFVHAGLFPGVPLAEQEEDVCLWIRDRFLLAERDFEGWPHIVHGHTPHHPWKEDPAQPELLPWRTNLDTAAFATGVLTVGVFEGEDGPPTRTLRITVPAGDGSASRLAPGNLGAASQQPREASPLPTDNQGRRG